MSAEIILRQRSGPIITIVVWAFLAFLLGDALVRGAWETVGRFAFLHPHTTMDVVQEVLDRTV